ncbi:MAG TPA: hypothetical protein V6C65_35880, partial [Allocoleopsis sp.]
MTKRRTFIALSALVASLFPFQKVLSQTGQSSTSTSQATDRADFLFVQTAKSMSYDSTTKKLTLVGVSPVTLFFSDRPQRTAGNMTTSAFIPFWSTGRDSFLSDPPNADLSILEGNTLKQVVVVLKAPVLEDDNLTYTIDVVEGDMPTSGNNASVFIDVIGM